VLDVILSDKCPLHILVAGAMICVRASLLSITMSFDAVSSRNRDDLIYRKLNRRATAELKVSTYIITNIAARSTVLATILVMMSASVFKTDVRLSVRFWLGVK
jgi:hypothetical protein